MPNELSAGGGIKSRVRRSFWCKIGFHKLVYVKQYLHTSKVECLKCGAKFIDGDGELFRV
jgi:hypothetical protein